MFVEDSGANIKLSSQDQSIPGVSDRIVTITGTLDQQLRAVALILTKLIEDPNYSQYVNTPISYPGKTLIVNFCLIKVYCWFSHILHRL
jgi:RNA-binding protein Nova